MNYGNEIKEILDEYSDIKLKIRLGIASEDVVKVVDFIEKCVSFLDAESRDIVKAVYIEKRNIRRLAKQGHYSRQTIYNKAKKTVGLIQKQFDSQKSLHS